MAARLIVGSTGALAAALALGACTVGPNYAPQALPPLAGGGFSSATPGAAVLQAPPPDWWRLYDDPVLDRLVQQALTENQNLKVAAAHLELARAALDEARTLRLPGTTTSGSYSYGTSRGSGGGGLGGGGAGGTGGTGSGGTSSSAGRSTYAVGLDVSYEFDLFGRIRRAIESAKADVGVQEAARDVVRITVAAETARAYADACAYAEAGEVARNSLGVVRQTYELTAFQRSAGAASDFEVSRAQALLEQTRASVPGYDAQRRSALYQLAVLTGRPPEEISPEAQSCRRPPRLDRPIPAGDGVGLLRRRPDVRQAERQLAGDTARIGVRVADLYPTISFGGSVGGVAVGGVTGGLIPTYGLGPSLTWAFPNVAPTLARIRQARATASASLASFNATVLQALSETEQALSTYGGELDRHAALASARDQDRRALQLAQLRYRAGSSSFIELLDAERMLIADDNALASSDELLAGDQITVFKALGGGWQGAPDVAASPVVDARTLPPGSPGAPSDLTRR